MIVDAAVIGGSARWCRRLDGLQSQLQARREQSAEDDARVAAIDRELSDLASLRDAAIPILAALEALPAHATWGEWIDQLRALAVLAVRDRDAILAALDELIPMTRIGPITLDEVRLVLDSRLGRNPPRRKRERRYGRVLVAATVHARAMEFDVVIVAGMTERVFPRKRTEDPILSDAIRERLDPRMVRRPARAADERLALRLACGAARDRIMLTFPRIDLDQGRPRVPSFYALEAMRAAQGRLPGFDELSRIAARESVPRLGFPAPAESADAIDDAEFDIAILDRLLDREPDQTIGAAHYLLGANPHLARALRARGRRWLRRWTPADGLVDPGTGAIGALARHQLAARAYSPTALQNYAACPYKFFLSAIHRLEPRDEIEALETIDPLTRGSIFASIQFDVLTALRDRDALPVTPANLGGALATLESLSQAAADRFREELAPAIDRVWNDGIESILADLREWMRRAAADPDRWRPERFELAFGLRDRDQADPASVPEPITIDEGLCLRGSIDLIEADSAGKIRVTDHKTGRARAPVGLVIGGGRHLQPVLYSLAVEKVLGAQISAGRLYYCTAAGGFEERIVPIDGIAREAVRKFAATLDEALRTGFIPAAPAPRECNFCDYRRVCGPYEANRTAIKPARRLDALTELRSRP
jgi:CRISPR/Cas system-associated exonuclease Cas4 (RecB family)